MNYSSNGRNHHFHFHQHHRLPIVKPKRAPELLLHVCLSWDGRLHVRRTLQLDGTVTKLSTSHRKMEALFIPEKSLDKF